MWGVGEGDIMANVHVGEAEEGSSVYKSACVSLFCMQLKYINAAILPRNKKMVLTIPQIMYTVK